MVKIFKSSLVILFLLVAVALAGNSSRGRYILNRYGSPFAHYKCNDNAADTTVLDSLVIYNGTYKSVGGNANTADHSVVGKFNNALDFVGDDDYIEVADNAAFTPAGTPFSISAVVYAEANNFVVVSKGVYNTDGEWVLRSGAGPGNLYFRVLDESVADCYIGRAGSALTQDVWKYIVVTYNGGTTSASCKIYMNGVQVDVSDSESNAGSFVAVENLGGNVHIAREDAAYSNGKIDNVMFFDRELTSAQVKRLYDIGKEITHDEHGNRERYRY